MGRRRRYCAEGSLAALALIVGLGVPGVRAAQASKEDAVLLRADKMVYDTDKDEVSAEGHVEIDNKGRILLAERVIYNQKTDTVSALGNVSLLNPDGNVAFADRMVLTNEMRDGVLDGFKALIGKTGRLVAASARKNGPIVTATRAAYTPCKLCAEKAGSAPTWDIKAERVVFDQREHRIYYHNATVELFGVPVLYSPIISHADPTVKHETGFLRPSGGTSSTLGTFVRLPYYFAISGSQDVTLEPMITSQAGQILLGEYRQRWNTGGMWLQPSLGYGRASGESSWHSSLFGSGRVPLNDIWRLGYDAELSSDQTYLKRYNISDEVTLDNDIFLAAQSGRSRFVISGYYFQDLREGRVAQNQIPLVMPIVEYIYQPRLPLLGGQFQFDLNSASVLRNIGTDSERISSDMRWRHPFVTDSGQLISVTADLRGDAWRVSSETGDPGGIVDLQGNPIAAGTRYIWRGQPSLALDWRWPFISAGSGAGRSYVVSPIAQLVVAPYGGNPTGIPNEDSADFELDDTDLFSLDRVPGHSAWESGPRANLGIQAEAFFPKGSVELLIGEVLRLKPDPIFAADSGLSGRNSDIVGRYRIRFEKYLSLTHRVDIDSTSGTLRRNEIYLDGDWGRSNIEISYVRLSQQTIALGVPRQEINGQFTLGIADNWLLFAAARRDLQSNQMLDTEFGVGWENDCLGISIAYQRRYTHFIDVPPSTSVLFNIIPKFSGDETASPRLFPRHVFAAPVQTAAVP